MIRTHFSHLLLLLVCFVVSGDGQSELPSLGGLVSDPSGSSVSNVAVSVSEVQTGVQRKTTTDGSGYYSFPSLPVGTYSIAVEQTGFSRQNSQITLDPAQKARLDFKLVIGATTATVNVEDSAPLLSVNDASLGTVVENEVIVQTPLFQRNWDDLIRLVPGVQQTRYTEQSGSTAAGRTGDFSVNGVHSLQNDFILDGIDNNTFSENVQEFSTQAVRPSVDVISEFRTITNPYSSEYGRSPGAAVEVTTKGGTNQVHGLLLEYLRNRVLDANDFFSNRSGLPKPENVQNQFGGNVGAPIIKNKLFGFFDYEGTRIRRGVTRISTVPLANERIGDFSPAAAAINGVTYPALFDVRTGQPFANNRIPAEQIDPYASKILALFPQPNLAGQFNNYARTGAVVDDTNSYNGRVDWNLNSSNLFFGRATVFDRARDIPGYYGGIADGSGTSAWGNSSLKGQAVALGFTHIFSAALVNDLRIGFIHNNAYAQQQPFGLNHTADYVPGIPTNPVVDGGLPLIAFDNFTFIGSPEYLPKQQNPQQWQFTDGISLLRGPHALKVGVDVRAPMRNLFQDEPDARGVIEFSGSFTCQRDPITQQCAGNGISYADALLGDVRSAGLSNVYLVDQRLWMASGYVQDDWKASPRLTFNLGLRYDFATPAYEAKDHLANFDPSGAGSLYFAKGESLGDRTLTRINTKNFGPRFGVAYAANQNTVIRGGYGIFYLLLERIGSENQMSLNPPFLINNNATVPTTATSPVFQLRNGYPVNFLDPNNIDYSIAHIRTVDPNSKTPSVQEWSFGIQQALPAKIVASVDYVGSKSTHLDLLNDLNQYVNGVLPYQNWGYLEHQVALGTGFYSSLQASLKRRFSRGLSLSAAYTWSKSIDNTPAELENTGVNPQNGRDLRSLRAVSDLNIPQRFVASYILELPFGKGKPFLTGGLGSALLGGWRTSGVYTFSSGLPFTVTSGGNYDNAIDQFGAASSLPNVIGTPTIVGSTDCWFYVSSNPACVARKPSQPDAFALQQVGQFGNAGRNILRGPHTNVFDFALMRDFRLVERLSLQARWEVFNLANTPLFALPDSTLTDGSVGTISSLSGDPRVMQFALRLSF